MRNCKRRVLPPRCFQYIILTLLSLAVHLKLLKLVLLFSCFCIVWLHDKSFLHFRSHWRHEDFVAGLLVPQANAFELLLLESVVKVGAHDQEVLHTRDTRVDAVINADVELACHLLRHFDELIEVDAAAAVRKQNVNELSDLFRVVILELYQIRSKDGLTSIPTALFTPAKCRFIFEGYVLQDDFDFVSADHLIIIDIIAFEGDEHLLFI